MLSSLTALVVLETEADYARFGIARNALKDILVVNDQGLGLMKRMAIVVPPAPKVPEPPKKPKGEAKAKKMSASAGRAGGDDGAAADGFKEAEGEAEAADDMDDAKVAEAEAEPDAAPPPPPASRAPARSAPSPEPMASAAPMAEESRRERRRDGPSVSADRAQEEPQQPKVEPYTGAFLEVMQLLRKNNVTAAEQKARGWREENKGDILALLALGEVFEAKGDIVEAGRAYGALVDLYTDRADIRRLAGARLDRLSASPKAGAAGKALWPLAEDTWRRAAEDRPDHPQGPRGYAWSLARQGRYAEAMGIIDEARKRGQPSGRFAGVAQILSDDLALMAAAWAAVEPKRKGELEKRLKDAGVPWEGAPSLRFVLWWETDANDVDFHIHDGKKNHAYYSQRDLSTGGSLYADVTTGFGPECFTIPGTPKAYPYRLEAHYYSRGPMGFGMGAMRVMQHDGKGKLSIEDRPFIIMVDGAYVDLGVVKGPLQ